jgi:hypothetical protein
LLGLPNLPGPDWAESDWAKWSKAVGLLQKKKCKGCGLIKEFGPKIGNGIENGLQFFLGCSTLEFESRI